ncbi:DUF6771 family protein [Sphingomonas endolithica]|uniref:DUF6771 family protein n=1 Tax=Sphingomonas endolithica TaxID=2972485 RepID=UPI0028A27350|nr:DUF6771 family protein [Sphingomonas sp. ZFBP2030]
MLDSPLTPATVPDLSDAILSAPGWCRVGIAMPDEAMRQRAAGELARAIVERLGAPEHNADQLTLAL